MKTLRYYLSDLHLSDQRSMDRGDAWFSSEFHKPQLLRFLEQQILAQADAIKEVVLLGDTFDNWLAPMDEAPPTYEEIFHANAEIMSRFQAMIQEGIRVVVVPGNHDYDLDHATVQAGLPGATFSPSHVDTHASIHAEHGHQMTFFNTTHLDGEFFRPIGYFFARLGEERLPGGHSPAAVAKYLRAGALKRLRHADCVPHIMKTIFKAAGLTREDRFVLNHHESWSVAEVLERYKDVGATMPVKERMWRLSQRPLELVGTAAKLGESTGKPVVILGHTHGQRLSLRRNGTWYANSGAWCQNHQSALMVEEDPDGLGVTLSVIGVEQGEVSVETKQFVPGQPEPRRELGWRPWRSFSK